VFEDEAGHSQQVREVGDLGALAHLLAVEVHDPNERLCEALGEHSGFLPKTFLGTDRRALASIWQ
jgi:hypothetical protein